MKNKLLEEPWVDSPKLDSVISEGDTWNAWHSTGESRGAVLPETTGFWRHTVGYVWVLLEPSRCQWRDQNTPEHWDTGSAQILSKTDKPLWSNATLTLESTYWVVQLQGRNDRLFERCAEKKMRLTKLKRLKKCRDVDSVCDCADFEGSATPSAPGCSYLMSLYWHHWFDYAAPISWQPGSLVLSCDQLKNKVQQLQEPFSTAAALKRKFARTVCITSQKECVSDAHRVVDVQVKLQIAKKTSTIVDWVSSLILYHTSVHFLLSYLPFSLNLRIGTVALISWVFSIYAANKAN